MKRLFIIGLMLFSHVDMALAESVSDRVFANLKAQGYLVVQQDRTWLGRIWVLARNETVQRELVFDPTTGEVLRDYTVLLADLYAAKKFDVAQSDGSDATLSTPPPTAVTAVEVTEPGVVAGDLTPPLVVASPTPEVIEPQAILSDDVQAVAEPVEITQ